MTCLDASWIRSAFERSNLPPEAWDHDAKLVDDLCSEQGLLEPDWRAFTAFSRVEAFRAPDGTPAVSDIYLMAVLDDVGLAMIREVGTFRKRTDCQHLMFSEFEGGEFLSQESVGGRGWGYMAIQAAHGSVPVFRLGWYFDERSSDPHHAVNAAASERDRVLAAIQAARRR